MQNLSHSFHPQKIHFILAKQYPSFLLIFLCQHNMKIVMLSDVLTSTLQPIRNFQCVTLLFLRTSIAHFFWMKVWILMLNSKCLFKIINYLFQLKLFYTPAASFLLLIVCTNKKTFKRLIYIFAYLTKLLIYLLKRCGNGCWETLFSYF